MVLLAYFRTVSESLHYALSDDGLIWTPLNHNTPVLTGTVGTKTLRDPFVFAGRNGDFHLLATNGWNSQSIVYAHSPDLVSWEAQKLLPVMATVPPTRNCWAAEAFWDKENERWQILWSSTVGTPANGDKHDHRIWGATTTDFQTLSPPQVFFDPGHNVIDASVVRAPSGKYLMAFKDERGQNAHGTDFKNIRIARSERAVGPWEIVGPPVSPTLTEGPIFVARPDTSSGGYLMLFDHFLDKHFGAAQSANGLDWTPIPLDHLSMDFGPRHGSAVVINEETAERLRAAFPP